MVTKNLEKQISDFLSVTKEMQQPFALWIFSEVIFDQLDKPQKQKWSLKQNP